jgi:RNA polymerase sigma factor (sigma-70 family)
MAIHPPPGCTGDVCASRHGDDIPQLAPPGLGCELVLGWLPERTDDRDVAADVAQQEAVLAALRKLPKRQRAAIVFRYFGDLSEQATAEALGCGVGTVKSQASRALATLRSNAALRTAIAEGSR